MIGLTENREKRYAWLISITGQWQNIHGLNVKKRQRSFLGPVTVKRTHLLIHRYCTILNQCTVLYLSNKAGQTHREEIPECLLADVEGKIAHENGKLSVTRHHRTLRKGIHVFLDASSHLYMRVCPSVRWSVRPYVR